MLELLHMGTKFQDSGPIPIGDWGTGDFYTVRPLMDMSIPLKPGVLRISFVHCTSKEDIEQIIEGLKNAL